MATGSIASKPFEQIVLPPNYYESVVTDDDKPVDSLYSERQHLLLTTALIDSWKSPGEGGLRYIATDVGLFYSPKEPPFSPDVMISLGVAPPPDQSLKKNRSYFLWEFNYKAPDAIVEVVSNDEGNELTKKFDGYAKIGILYYIVWDPFLFLSETTLHCFVLQDGKYVVGDPWFPVLELGVTIWEGSYGGMSGPFLRWCDQEGNVLPTGGEAAIEAERKLLSQRKQTVNAKQRAQQEKQRAEQEKQRAEQEKQRADKLAEKLRALGVDPDQP